MGCIKSKEVVHLDAMTQHNVDSVLSPIKHNQKDNKENSLSANYLSEHKEPIHNNNNVNRNSTNYNTIMDSNNVKVSDVYQTIGPLSKNEKCTWFKIKKIGEDVFNAMKVIDADDISNNKEFSIVIGRIINNVRHIGLVDVVNYFQDDNKVYVVTEFISGENLFEYLVHKGSMSERSVHVVIAQLIKAVEYLHGSGMTHRMLSLKNIHVVSKDKHGMDEHLTVKITNYFISSIVTKSNVVCNSKGRVESPHLLNTKLKRDINYYSSPEVVSGHSDIDYTKVDVWSIGVIMCMLILGASPFDGETQQDVNSAVVKQRVNIEQLKHVSAEGRDFLCKVLHKDAKDRLTIRECLSHKWIEMYNHSNIDSAEEKRNNQFVEATTHYINTVNNSTAKLQEIFTDNDVTYTKTYIIKSIEQYEGDDETHKRTKIKLLECLPSYEKDTFNIQEYTAFINQINKTKHKKETDIRKNSFIKGNDNSDSEDSFIIYSEDKKANKFDREKFLRLIDNDDSDISV